MNTPQIYLFNPLYSWIIFFPYKECWVNTLVKCSLRCVCVYFHVYLSKLRIQLLVSYTLISLCVYKARSCILAYSVCTHLTLLSTAKLFFKLHSQIFRLVFIASFAKCCQFSSYIVCLFDWFEYVLCIFLSSHLKILYMLPPSMWLEFSFSFIPFLHFLFYGSMIMLSSDT